MGTTKFNIHLIGEDPGEIRLLTPVVHTTAKVTIADTATWAERTTFVPKDGEICIWSDKQVIDGVNYPGIKIGDGSSYVLDLPFFGDNTTAWLLGIINDHINDEVVHITSEERSHWLDCHIEGDMLVFERHG